MALRPRLHKNLSYLLTLTFAVGFSGGSTPPPFGHLDMADSTTSSHSALTFNPASGVHTCSRPRVFRSRLYSFTLPFSEHIAMAWADALMSAGSRSIASDLRRLCLTPGKAKYRPKKADRSVWSSPRPTIAGLSRVCAYDARYGIGSPPPPSGCRSNTTLGSNSPLLCDPGSIPCPPTPRVAFMTSDIDVPPVLAMWWKWRKSRSGS